MMRRRLVAWSVAAMVGSGVAAAQNAGTTRVSLDVNNQANPQIPVPSQTSARVRNPERVWERLSDPPFDASKFAAVEGIELIRDAIHIKLTDGVIQFAEPADGREFGAAFSGHGRLQIAPPNAIELAQLKLRAKQETLDIEFTEATFCFADGTFEEIAGQVRWRPPTNTNLGNLYHERQNYRENNALEMLPRLFQAVLSKNPQRGNYFAAELKTKNHGWMLVRFDPNELEQVSVGRWFADPLGPRPGVENWRVVESWRFEPNELEQTSACRRIPGPSGPRTVVDAVESWMRFPAGRKSAIDDQLRASSKPPFTVDGYEIDASGGSKGELEATTNAHVKFQKDGERVLLFSLNAELRVESVADSNGTSLSFFQSRKPSVMYQLHHGDYVVVVLPRAEESESERILKFRYAGKRAISTPVEDTGIETYRSPSRWYPVPWIYYDSLGQRSRFHVTFRSPQKMTFLASGRILSESQEGDKLVTTWENDAPQSVAGFVYGNFYSKGDIFDSITVDAYFNPEMPFTPGRYAVDPKQARALLLEGSENLIHVLDPYFGALPYRQISVVENGGTTGTVGPGLLSMNAGAFLHVPSFATSVEPFPGWNTVRQGQAPPIPRPDRLSMDDSLSCTILAGQTFAQQWWGQWISPATYHDQWLFAALSQFSGLLYASALESQSNYLDALNDYRAYLERSPQGISESYESLGPLWMGGRLSPSVAPDGFGPVSRYKGPWIIHMLRMMMWDPERKDPDEEFKAMMHDFVITFANRAASTEDFKAMVEKHMTPEMDMEHDRNMDWFFRQYVYGTGIPKYSFSFEKLGEENGQWDFKCKITRTGVPADWKDLLVVDQHENGKDYRLKVVQMNAPDVVFNLELAAKPGRIHLADFDVLADFKQ